MDITIRKPCAKNTDEVNPQIFMINEPAQSWEIWHKRFGHVGYTGLQYMLDKNLVNGFNVDTQTTKLDCIVCTEAKQSVEPFDQHIEKETEPGDLTHIDLWGKYDVASIHGNHYYLLMVDNSSRYVSTEFLKEKKKAMQKVKNYLAYGWRAGSGLFLPSFLPSGAKSDMYWGSSTPLLFCVTLYNTLDLVN